MWITQGPRGYRIGLAVAACMAKAVLSSAPAVAAPEVNAVRLGLHPEWVRVVLETNTKLEVVPFLLANPYRAVLDLPEVRWRLAPGAGQTGKGFVTGYRFGQFRPGLARMVFDLERPAVIAKSFFIPPAKDGPWRYVLDLRRTTAAEALARVGRPPDAGRPGGRTAGYAPVPTQRPPPARRVVMIDPGHGGVDPGAIGRRKGVYEKNVMLAMAMTLRRELRGRGRYKVVMTREGDQFVRLRRRIALARAAGADLFISLHADSLEDRSVRGASVYTLSETASDKEAAALAAKENKADLIAGVDLSRNSDEVANILIDLAQRETMNHSARFAKLLIKEMSKTTSFLRKSHRFAGFAVLKAPDVPSVLLELGYLSNTVEERRLTQPRYQARMAKAIVRAIDRYFETAPEAATR